ncbi:UNVERIFIED_CONTAM: hypothetical protein NCL1_39931 [Trichonephila clavipes]
MITGNCIVLLEIAGFNLEENDKKYLQFYEYYPEKKEHKRPFDLQKRRLYLQKFYLTLSKYWLICIFNRFL